MTFEQTEFDFGSDDTGYIFTNLYDSVGKTIGISTAPPNYGSTTYNVGINSGAITGAVGATGPSLWSHGLTGAAGNYNSSSYPTITFNDNNWYTNGSNALDIKGDANFEGDVNFEGDIKIKGKKILDMLERIEERLAILHPNSALEEKWEELRELGAQYRKLEKTILEKEKIVDILKK